MKSNAIDLWNLLLSGFVSAFSAVKAVLDFLGDSASPSLLLLDLICLIVWSANFFLNLSSYCKDKKVR